jgi:hypothetical protein
MNDLHPQIATAEESAELKAMWNEIFQEEPDFLETYFTRRYRPEDVVVIIQDGAIASSLHALPCTVEGQPCRYIVGAATWPRWRRHGMMGALLSFARTHYGVPMALYPEETARDLYGKCGFHSQSIWVYDLPGEEGAIPPSPKVTAETLDAWYHATGPALERDALAWEFFLDEFHQNGVAVDGAYALIRSQSAVEVGYHDEEALERLIPALRRRGIRTMVLRQRLPLPYPVRSMLGGMYDDKKLANVFVGEQY